MYVIFEYCGVSLIGLFCKRDLEIHRSYWPKPPHMSIYVIREYCCVHILAYTILVYVISEYCGVCLIGLFCKRDPEIHRSYWPKPTHMSIYVICEYCCVRILAYTILMYVICQYCCFRILTYMGLVSFTTRYHMCVCVILCVRHIVNNITVVRYGIHNSHLLSCIFTPVWASRFYCYGVATVSRIDKITGHFCRIASLL